MKKVRRCYIYIRVSTAMQVEGYSLEAQKEKLKKYAEYQKMEIVREYCDAGRSGKSISGRPEFTRMLKDIEDEKDAIDYVLVFKLSRFGRNAADVLNSLQLLQDYGVNLICVEDGIDSSKDSGKLMITVLSAVAEIERENILVQTMEGRKQKAREGKWSAGITPIGYSLEKGTGKLLVVEDEAKIVRLIFDMYTKQDKTPEQIAQYLNSHGYEKKKSREREITYFQRRYIITILDNPVYVGKIVYGRRVNEKVKGTRDQYHKVWTDDYVEADGMHEPIIDKVTWELARLKRERTGLRWVKTHSLEHEHILTGLIRCPVCGKTMCGTVSRHTKKGTDIYKDTFYYRCLHNGRMEDGSKCDFRGNLNQDKFNAEIEGVIRKLVEHEDLRKHIEAKLMEMTDVSKLEEEREQTVALLEQTKGAKERLMEQMDTLDGSDRHYRRKMEDMQVRLDGLYDKIADIEGVIRDIDVRIEGAYTNKFSTRQVYEILMNFDKFYDMMTDMEKKEFMRLFVEWIEIRPEVKKGETRFRRMKLKFPVYLDGVEGDEVCLRDGEDVETVCLLSKGDVKSQKLRVEFSLEDMDTDGFKKGATYNAIRDWIKEKYGYRVTNLNIAQVKQKHGIIERENYNKPKSLGSKQPRCPEEKVKAIEDAMRHFQMI